MATFTTRATIASAPERVLDVLTDPRACARWAPVEFDIEDFDGDRLRRGSRARVAGRIAGRELSFDVEILDASDGRLKLRAVGPIAIEADYGVAPSAGGAELVASIVVSNRGGFVGALVSRATDALLAAGALDAAVSRIARTVEASPQAVAA